MLNDFRTAIGRALSDGTTLQEFRKSFDSIVKKHGWEHTGTPGWRAKIIYETNIASAYSAGRYRQMTTPTALELYPYWRYVHHSCAHPRPTHVAWSGTVLRNDDPWWGTHYPPNGWHCHCSVEVVSDARMERNGWSVDEAPPLERKPWRNPATGKIEMVPKGIDPGFQSNQGLEWAKAEKARASSSMTPLTHVGGLQVEQLPAPARMKVQKEQIAQFASMKPQPVGMVEAGTLPPKVQELLGSQTAQVLLSAETLMKNQTHHPELTPDEYAQLAALLADPDYVLEEKQEGRVSLVAQHDSIYRFIVKRTRDGKENFILSMTRMRQRPADQLVRNRTVLFAKQKNEGE
nr:MULTISPECIES: phage minor head protein [unclassified Saccharibacter]